MKPRAVRLCLRAIALWMCLFVWLTLPMSAGAQAVITDDEVNRLANRLYCPVCPNETLDACRTEACAQWREEIRAQLQAGASEQQVIDDFVARFGERVIGSPQDPALRALAVGIPVVIAAAAVIIGVVTFARWRGRPAASANLPVSDVPLNDLYRSQIERDLE
jgi:cytochrome c-type biogenesis protein CcmH